MKEKKSMVNVPYIVYEKDMDHKNRTITVLGVSLIISILTIVATVYMFMSFINKNTFTSYNQDGNGINNMNSGVQGDVTNESTTKDNN